MSSLFQLPSPTPAQELLLNQSSRLDNVLNTIHMHTVQSFREFWYGAVPPAALLAELGTNAVRAFQAHAAAVTFLVANGVTLTPEDCVPPLAYTAHEDGSITLNPTEV